MLAIRRAHAHHASKNAVRFGSAIPDRESPNVDRLEQLRTAAIALYGADWQSPVARSLGPLRPTGPKKPLAVRHVQMWASGARPVPAWVPDALTVLLHQEAGRRRADAARLDALASRLVSAPGPEPAMDGPSPGM